ncbi:hypothetical protein ACU8KH_03205 [Lachancea thermotolerans]
MEDLRRHAGTVLTLSFGQCYPKSRIHAMTPILFEELLQSFVLLQLSQEQPEPHLHLAPAPGVLGALKEADVDEQQLFPSVGLVWQQGISLKCSDCSCRCSDRRHCTGNTLVIYTGSTPNYRILISTYQGQSLRLTRQRSEVQDLAALLGHGAISLPPNQAICASCLALYGNDNFLSSCGRGKK